MINRFKIWFNRNNYRIIITILGILIVYISIKWLNNYFKNYKEDSEKNVTVIGSTYNNIEGEYLYEKKDDISSYQKVDNSEDDYGVLQNIIKIIFGKVAKANQNGDSSIKEELYDMCADSFIDDMSSYEKEPNSDNILNYYPGVKLDNIDKYYIGEIYRFYQYESVKGFVVEMRYDLGDNNYENNLIVIYVDFNSKTFLYGGGYARLEGINCSIDIDSISSNGSNTF